MKRKGFTLIELLAVIIILGILMLIAIPSVTSYINNSRKETYVDTIKELIKGTVVKINSGELDVYDTDTTYYIPASAIDLENGDPRSPYGKFDEAYVVIAYDGDKYDYYFVGKDEKDMGIEAITNEEMITKDLIKEVDDLDLTIGLRGKDKIVIFDDELNPGTPQNALSKVSGNGDSCTIEESERVVYPPGKNKCNAELGDLVKIGTEEFYVISNDKTAHKLTMITHYNLNVGNSKRPGAPEGLQDSKVRGYVSRYYTTYGGVAFSTTNYWNTKVGRNLYYKDDYCGMYSLNAEENKVCAYVYDSNSSIKAYVDTYKGVLEEMGVTIHEARLLRVEEAWSLGCGNGTWSCSVSPANAPEWLYETSFWLGSAYSWSNIGYIRADGSFNCNGYWYDNDYGLGVRPVIVY